MGAASALAVAGVAASMLSGCGSVKTTDDRVGSRVSTETPSLPPGHGSPSKGVKLAPAESIVDRGVPLLAIWKQEGRLEGGQLIWPDRPALRVAVWEDGYVLHASDPTKWAYGLKAGRISRPTVDGIRVAIEEAGISDLRNHCYTTFDGTVVCVLVRADGRARILYGDGIMRSGVEPDRAAFDRLWAAINTIALRAIPGDSTPVDMTFRPPPADWYPDPMVRRQ